MFSLGSILFFSLFIFSVTLEQKLLSMYTTYKNQILFGDFIVFECNLFFQANTIENLYMYQ